MSPFKSKKQMRWMWLNDPAMAKKWAEHTPNIKDLPETADGDEMLEKSAEDYPETCPNCGSANIDKNFEGIRHKCNNCGYINEGVYFKATKENADEIFSFPIRVDEKLPKPEPEIVTMPREYWKSTEKAMDISYDYNSGKYFVKDGQFEQIISDEDLASIASEIDDIPWGEAQWECDQQFLTLYQPDGEYVIHEVDSLIQNWLKKRVLLGSAQVVATRETSRGRGPGEIFTKSDVDNIIKDFGQYQIVEWTNGETGILDVANGREIRRDRRQGYIGVPNEVVKYLSDIRRSEAQESKDPYLPLSKDVMRNKNPNYYVGEKSTSDHVELYPNASPNLEVKYVPISKGLWSDDIQMLIKQLQAMNIPYKIENDVLLVPSDWEQKFSPLVQSAYVLGCKMQIAKLVEKATKEKSEVEKCPQCKKGIIAKDTDKCFSCGYKKEQQTKEKADLSGFFQSNKAFTADCGHRVNAGDYAYREPTGNYLCTSCADAAGYKWSGVEKSSANLPMKDMMDDIVQVDIEDGFSDEEIYRDVAKRILELKNETHLTPYDKFVIAEVIKQKRSNLKTVVGTWNPTGNEASKSTNPISRQNLVTENVQAVKEKSTTYKIIDKITGEVLASGVNIGDIERFKKEYPDVVDIVEESTKIKIGDECPKCGATINRTGAKLQQCNNCGEIFKETSSTDLMNGDQDYPLPTNGPLEKQVPRKASKEKASLDDFELDEAKTAYWKFFKEAREKGYVKSDAATYALTKLSEYYGVDRNKLIDTVRNMTTSSLENSDLDKSATNELFGGYDIGNPLPVMSPLINQKPIRTNVETMTKGGKTEKSDRWAQSIILTVRRLKREGKNYADIAQLVKEGFGLKEFYIEDVQNILGK